MYSLTKLIVVTIVASITWIKLSDVYRPEFRNLMNIFSHCCSPVYVTYKSRLVYPFCIDLKNIYLIAIPYALRV